MAAEETKALELCAQAEKRTKAWGLFNPTKFADAAELYNKAGNLFKMAKKNEQAADAYLKAADCFIKSDSKHEASSAYINASNVIKKSNPNAAVEYLERAIAYYAEEGRCSIAAKHQKEIAEILESSNDLEKCMEAYEKAAAYYEGENSPSSANACLLKVAQYAAQTEKYDKATTIYEQVASTSLDNTLLKWNVKNYLLHAGLCHLCSGDIVAAKRALEKYQDMDSSFAATREYKLLSAIAKACEELDVDQFTAAVVDYDSITKLDNWKTSILLRIKNTIKHEDEKVAL